MLALRVMPGRLGITSAILVAGCSKPVKPAWTGSLDTWATGKFICCEGARPVWPRAGKSRARQTGREGGNCPHHPRLLGTARGAARAEQSHRPACRRRASWLTPAPLNSATTVVYTQIQSASIRRERTSREAAALGVILPAASHVWHRHPTPCLLLSGPIFWHMRWRGPFSARAASLPGQVALQGCLFSI